MQKMSEKEINELLDKLIDLSNDLEVDMFSVANLNAFFEESADTIRALFEEIQQYRTIENELKENYKANVDIKMLMQYFIETIFKNEKHEGFKILTNEDAKMWDAYKAIGTVEEIKQLKENGSFNGNELAIIASNLIVLRDYQSIGTVDQCREAVERIKPKKPVEYEDKYYGCPKCANPLMHKWEKYPTTLKPKSKGLPCCWNCLQVIDWSE